MFLILLNEKNESKIITISIGIGLKMQKIIIHAKKFISGILLHVAVKMVNMKEVLLTIQ